MKNNLKRVFANPLFYLATLAFAGCSKIASNLDLARLNPEGRLVNNENIDHFNDLEIIQNKEIKAIKKPTACEAPYSWYTPKGIYNNYRYSIGSNDFTPLVSKSLEMAMPLITMPYFSSLISPFVTPLVAPKVTLPVTYLFNKAADRVNMYRKGYWNAARATKANKDINVSEHEDKDWCMVNKFPY